MQSGGQISVMLLLYERSQEQVMQVRNGTKWRCFAGCLADGNREKEKEAGVEHACWSVVNDSGAANMIVDGEDGD